MIPLASRGYHVLAVECDREALDGGAVELPGYVPGQMLGLRRRLGIEDLASRVTIYDRNLFDLDRLEPSDAVWTSCSWHYSINHRRPLGEFVDRLQALCRPGGLLGAEFMMAVEPRHEAIEHYLEEGEVRRYLTGWDILWEASTPAFVEAPHVEQLKPHTHRMGLVIARRPD
ncbi:MAG: hypothetical protein ACRDN9_10040 [Streptosporangiaceae bacterium]